MTFRWLGAVLVRGLLAVVFAVAAFPFVARADTPSLIVRFDTMGLMARDCDEHESYICNVLARNLALVGEQQRDAMRIAARANCGHDIDAGCWQLGISIILDAAAIAPKPGSADFRMRELERANRLFRSSCQQGSQESCRQLILSDGWLRPIATDKPGLVARMTQLCDAGLASACDSVGEARDFPGFALDLPHGQQALIKGCQLNDPRACNKVADLIDKGELSAALSNGFPAVSELYAEACRGGSYSACDTLGGFYAEGKHVQKNLTQAVSLYEAACALGYGAGCVRLADQLLDGNGVPADPQRAAGLYTNVCKLDLDPHACIEESALLTLPGASARNLIAGRDLLLRTCTNGLPRDECEQLASIEQRLVALHEKLGQRGPVRLPSAKTNYAKEALARHERGLSNAHFTIASDGAVRNCSAKGTTPDLDAATCQTIEHWRFLPAIDRMGRASSSTENISIGWFKATE